MITLAFATLGVEPPGLQRLDDALLNVVATFRLEADGRTLYSEVDFPIVELAADLRRWAAFPMHARSDFDFESLESEEVGLVRFHRVGSMWAVGSVLQHNPSPAVHSDIDVEQACREFIAAVEQACRDELELDLAQLWAKLDSQ